MERDLREVIGNQLSLNSPPGYAGGGSRYVDSSTVKCVKRWHNRLRVCLFYH